jgi:hypothetical protein
MVATVTAACVICSRKLSSDEGGFCILVVKGDVQVDLDLKFLLFNRFFYGEHSKCHGMTDQLRKLNAKGKRCYFVYRLG